jgi:hypothetical protein
MLMYPLARLVTVNIVGNMLSEKRNRCVDHTARAIQLVRATRGSCLEDRG